MKGYKSTSTKGYIPFDPIEPQLVRHHKEVDRYIKALKITLPQEEFILKTLLSQDWHRRLIISHIDMIKREGSLGMTKYKFSLKAPSISLDYCDSNPYKEKGWREGINTFEDRAWAVYHTFTNRLRR